MVGLPDQRLSINPSGRRKGITYVYDPVPSCAGMPYLTDYFQ